MLDCYYHIFANLFIVIFLNWWGFNEVKSIKIAFVASFLKEMFDYYIQSEFISVADLIADLIGIILFVIFLKIKEQCYH